VLLINAVITAAFLVYSCLFLFSALRARGLGQSQFELLCIDTNQNSGVLFQIFFNVSAQNRTNALGIEGSAVT
jgi:hypothetical protein